MAFHGMRLGLLLCFVSACLLGSSTSLDECSNGCESNFCTVAPFLRYGRYCGLFYTGCHGEVPCDGLDSCCKDHDNCIALSGDYLNVQCNQKLLDCLSAYIMSGQPQFRGTQCLSKTVADTIEFAIRAGVWIGRRIPAEDAQKSSAPTDFHGR
eukprot:PITA_26435